MTQLHTTLRPGTTRGMIEFRQSFAGWALLGQLFWPLVTIAAIFFLRDRSVPGGQIALGAMILPGTLGMFVTFGTLLMIQYMAADREDGTLLRAKATPNGIVGYLIGMVVKVSATILVYLAIVLVAGVVIVDGLELGRVGSWVTFVSVLMLGLLATLTLGAMLGAIVSTPRAVGYLSVVVMGLVAISGIFYPITPLPGWLQTIAQLFPMYWLGLGMRSAMLPDAAAAVEIAHSWRYVETALVLGGWCVIGALVAPIVLRRMARKESGSAVADRRERLLQGIG